MKALWFLLVALLILGCKKQNQDECKGYSDSYEEHRYILAAINLLDSLSLSQIDTSHQLVYINQSGEKQTFRRTLFSKKYVSVKLFPKETSQQQPCYTRYIYNWQLANNEEQYYYMQNDSILLRIGFFAKRVILDFQKVEDQVVITKASTKIGVSLYTQNFDLEYEVPLNDKWNNNYSYIDTITINGKKFSNLYQVKQATKPNPASKEEIYYSETDKLVAFKLSNGEIWIKE